MVFNPSTLVLPRAGQGIRKMAVERLLHVFRGLSVMFAVGGLLLGIIVPDGLHVVVFFAVFPVMAGALIFIRRQDRVIERLSLAATGEIAVAEVLDRLRASGGRVFHHMLPGNSKIGDIDHILVHPSGVYVIETKTINPENDKSAKVPFNVWKRHDGKRSAGEQARDAAVWVAAQTEAALGRRLWIQAVLCYPFCDQPMSAAGGHVTVVNGKGLYEYIRRRPAVLTPNDVGTISRRLRGVQLLQQEEAEGIAA